MEGGGQMYEKILVTLDGSELAEIALPYAEELAGQLGSEITLLYVADPAVKHQDSMRQNYLQKMVEVTMDNASKYSNEPAADRGVKVKSVVLTGRPAENIVDYADKENIGLIIMATHGQSGFKRWALGSVADKVLRATTRPVELIRARTSHPDTKLNRKLNKVLIPLDGSGEGEAILPYIEELARMLGVKVILLRVLATGYATMDNYVPLTEQQMKSDRALAAAYLNNLRTRLEEKGIATTTEERLSEWNDASAQIIQLADEVQVDLVAMTTHGRSGAGRQVFGSVADKVLHEGETPLLLVRSAGTGKKR
jgi:nucleotide-binding universal stress UspA family protein